MSQTSLTVTTDYSRMDDDAQIRQLIADQQDAICAKDVDRIMVHYATQVIAFDVKPPFRTIGADSWRQTWESCLPYFPDSFQIDTRDLCIALNGNLAIAHWLFRFTGMEKDHPAMQSWMRTTAAYQRKQTRWQIIHEHVSVPFNPETSQAVFTLNP